VLFFGSGDGVYYTITSWENPPVLFASLSPVYPPTDLRIVITAGYIVESSLGVVVVPTVAQRVDFCLGAGA
jgi:hypothetical protein